MSFRNKNNNKIPLWLWWTDNPCQLSLTNKENGQIIKYVFHLNPLEIKQKGSSNLKA